MAAALTIPTKLGQIRSSAGYVYQLVPEDLLWLARAVQFEGGSDHAATVWTYAQMAVRRNTSSLKSLIRAHSQTVNPLWDEATDSKCITHPEHCTDAQLARRARARSIPWAEISPEVRSLVVDWAQARVANPVPRATDFANARVSQSFISRHPGTEIVKKAGNWYLATPDVVDWPRNFVTMYFRGAEVGTEFGSDIPWWIWAAGAASLLGVGALAYYLGDDRYKQWR